MKKFFAFVSALILLVAALSSCGVAEDVKTPDETEKAPEKKVYEIVGSIIGKNSYYVTDVTDDDIAAALVEAYSDAAGDKYAKYYSAEEYASLMEGNAGEKVGIGIVVIENTDLDCIEIIGIVPGTPAEATGLEIGDLIVRVGIGESAEKVSALGYDIARKKLAGDESSLCEFGVIRGENSEDIIEFSVKREKYTYDSVMFEVCEADASVGIVKIREFNLTTPLQFKNAINSLLEKGCESFVFDVRNNAGGQLDSVMNYPFREAIITFLLNC